MVTNKPTYDLAEIKFLVRTGKYLTSARIRNYLLNHDYPPPDTTEDVINAILKTNFYKSVELHNAPGIYADVYRHVNCYSEEWYVKLFIDENQKIRLVSIWSLNEEGSQH